MQRVHGYIIKRRHSMLLENVAYIVAVKDRRNRRSSGICVFGCNPNRTRAITLALLKRDSSARNPCNSERY